jgi:hypothetical protein
MGKPKVGDKVTVRGLPCQVVKIHPAGTVDVVAQDGRYLRVSGLMF